MGFYPENYEVKVGGGSFMRLTQGENRFRIMSEPTIGYQVWSDGEGGKRAVARYSHSIPGGKEFNAFVVWNYGTQAIEILEITQKGIMADIYNLAMDPEWGDPRNFDLVINRTGSGQLDTRYSVTPKPAKPVTTEIAKALVDANIDVKEALTITDTKDFESMVVNTMTEAPKL